MAAGSVRDGGGGVRGGGSRLYFLHGVRAASDSKEALDVLDWSIGQMERRDLLAVMLLQRQALHRPISSKRTR